MTRTKMAGIGSIVVGIASIPLLGGDATGGFVMILIGLAALSCKEE